MTVGNLYQRAHLFGHILETSGFFSPEDELLGVSTSALFHPCCAKLQMRPVC